MAACSHRSGSAARACRWCRIQHNDRGLGGNRSEGELELVPVRCRRPSRLTRRFAPDLAESEAGEKMVGGCGVRRSRSRIPTSEVGDRVVGAACGAACRQHAAGIRPCDGPRCGCIRGTCTASTVVSPGWLGGACGLSSASWEGRLPHPADARGCSRGRTRMSGRRVGRLSRRSMWSRRCTGRCMHAHHRGHARSGKMRHMMWVGMEGHVTCHARHGICRTCNGHGWEGRMREGHRRVPASSR